MNKDKLRFFIDILAVFAMGFAWHGAALAAGYPAEHTLWPDWLIRGQPLRTIHLHPGASLFAAMQRLQPGDRLIIHGGTYLVEGRFTLHAVGTPQAPIWIQGAAGERAIIVHKGRDQNILNVDQSRYLAISNLVLRGGSTGVKIYRADHFVMENCEVLATADVAISANSGPTSHLAFLGNHLHHTGGAGDGLYLGDHAGRNPTTHSVIYNNLIHDLMVQGGAGRSFGGNGVQIKKNSFANVIKDNVIFNLPAVGVGVLLYGAKATATNVVVGNHITGGAIGMQIQGEAVVANNRVVAASQVAFLSRDHTGKAANLHITGNYFAGSPLGIRLDHFWTRDHMRCHDNVIMIPNGIALDIRDRPPWWKQGQKLLTSATANGEQEQHELQNNRIMGRVAGVPDGLGQIVEKMAPERSTSRFFLHQQRVIP